MCDDGIVVKRILCNGGKGKEGHGEETKEKAKHTGFIWIPRRKISTPAFFWEIFGKVYKNFISLGLTGEI